MAEIALKLESIIAASERPNFVGTVGKIDVFPNESNVIPREVIFTIDVRDSIMDSKDELLKEIIIFAKEIEIKRKVEIKLDVRHHDYPVDCDKSIIKLIQGAAKSKGYAYHDMVSGAFHDALSVASFAPIGMIFVPCKGGISHSPAEWAEYEDIAKGADVLTEVLFTLANS